MKPSLLCIVGARPQFIKHKPVWEAFSQFFHVSTLHTDQHFEVAMSERFFAELGLPEPDFRLRPRSQGSSAHQVASMLEGIDEVLAAHRPDGVLVYGDTNSTLAGAIVAAQRNLPLFHVEAGLRSYNRSMPEEKNRVITDHLSQLLFAPTEAAVKNLRREGLSAGVHHTGDVMCDVLQAQLVGLTPKRSGSYLFATIHRPANTDPPGRLGQILATLDSLPWPVVLPVHPRTRLAMQREQLDHDQYANIDFCEPMGYRESLSYQKFCECVLTDSGGMQKEAYLLGKRCLTLRSETEWPETLQGNCNQLVGDELSSLAALITSDTSPEFGEPYGNGQAAHKMAVLAADFFSLD